MRTISDGDTFELAGQPWKVVHQDATVVVFQHLLDRRVRRLPVAELFADESFVTHAPSPGPLLEDVGILDGLPEKDVERALFLRRHVHEVLYGEPPVEPDSRESSRKGSTESETIVEELNPSYGPTVGLMARVVAKTAELAAAGTPVSERQFRRHVSAYRTKGVAGLVDQRKLRPSTVTGRVDERVVALLKKEMAAQTFKSTRTRQGLIASVLVKVGDLNDAGAEIPVPSRATMYRAVVGLDGARHTFGDATTRRTQANKPDRAYGYQAVTRPGELVEIDSTPLDALVIFPDGSIRRPDLTIAFDVATRTICATMLLAGAAKSADAAGILLARTLTPLAMHPGWDESLSHARSILPPGAIVGDDELRRLIAARPVIAPEARPHPGRGREPAVGVVRLPVTTRPVRHSHGRQ